ncbi:MAG: polyprenyl synthetase family protein [Deltaproteobacteria bacterium]|nr:polyprenyl synthetase family protein [Deltaproteobacteria bacterium]
MNATTSNLHPLPARPSPQSTWAPDVAGADPAFAAELEATMLRLATGDRFERLGAIAHEHFLAGPRRQRGELVRELAQVLSVPLDRSIPWAAACELIHAASLIHDDLEDRSRWRQGSYSVWVRHGEAQAINAGDLLLMLPFLALESLPTDPATAWSLSRAIARRAVETVRGQSLELCLIASGRRTLEAYEEAVRGKSRVRWVLPVQGLAILAGLSEAQAEACAEPFAALGLACQLADEVRDLYGQGRERRGDRLREGKVSALLVEHLTRVPKDLEWLGPLLGKSASETTPEEIDRAALAFRGSGALAAVQARLQQLLAALPADQGLAAHPGLMAVAQARLTRVVVAVADLS